MQNICRICTFHYSAYAKRVHIVFNIFTALEGVGSLCSVRALECSSFMHYGLEPQAESGGLGFSLGFVFYSMILIQVHVDNLFLCLFGLLSSLEVLVFGI